MEEPSHEISWVFTDIFASNESRIAFVTQSLVGFKNFPPDTKLNPEELNAVLSLMVKHVPYSFVVFVYECVDPSITSNNLTHRIAFGNFLLALPVSVLFPQFIHLFLSLFKTCDRLRKGVIRRSVFLEILRETFKSFISSEKSQSSEEEEDDDEEEGVEHKINFENCQLTIDRSHLPSYDLVQEVQRATKGLEECSVQTLLFIMWQKDATLLSCKSTRHPSVNSAA
jgi:hypothetical protein